MYAGRSFKFGPFPDTKEKSRLINDIKAEGGFISASENFTDYIAYDSTGNAVKRHLKGKKMPLRILVYNRESKELTETIQKDVVQLMSSLSLNDPSNRVTRSNSKQWSQSSPTISRFVTKSASKALSQSQSIFIKNSSDDENRRLLLSTLGTDKILALNEIDDNEQFLEQLKKLILNDIDAKEKYVKRVLADINLTIDNMKVQKENELKFTFLVRKFRERWGFNAASATELSTENNPYFNSVFRFSRLVGTFFSRIYPIYQYFQESSNRLLKDSSRRSVSLAQYGIVNLHFIERWKSYCTNNVLERTLVKYENLNIHFTRQGYDLKSIPFGLVAADQSTEFIINIAKYSQSQSGLFLVPQDSTSVIGSRVNHIWNSFYAICVEYYHGQAALPEEPIRSFWSRIIRCLLFNSIASVYVTEEFQMKKLLTYNSVDHRVDIVASQIVPNVSINREGAFVFLAVEVSLQEVETEDPKDYQKLQLEMMAFLLDKISLFDLKDARIHSIVESLRVYGLYICGSQYQICMIRVVLEPVVERSESAPPMSFVFETFSDLLFDLCKMPSYTQFTEKLAIFDYPSKSESGSSSPLSSEGLRAIYTKNPILLDETESSVSVDTGVKFNNLRGVPYRTIHQNFMTLYNFFYHVQQENKQFLNYYRQFGSLSTTNRIIYKFDPSFAPPEPRRKNEHSTPRYKETAKARFSPPHHVAVRTFNIMQLFIGCAGIVQLISYEMDKDNINLTIIQEELDPIWILKTPFDICSEFHIAMLFIWNGLQMLQSLASKRVIHCNIHPDVIQFDRITGNFKLTGFENSVILPEGMDSILIENQFTNMKEDDYEYICREVIKTGRYSFKTDRWSLGQVIRQKIFFRIQLCLIDRMEIHDDLLLEELSDRVVRMFRCIQEDDELNVNAVQEDIIGLLNWLENLHQKRNRMNCEGMEEMDWIRSKFKIPMETQKLTGSIFLKKLSDDIFKLPVSGVKYMDISTRESERDTHPIANVIQ